MKINQILLAVAVIASFGCSQFVMAIKMPTGGHYEGGMWIPDPVIPPLPSIPQIDIGFAVQKDADIKLVAPTDLNIDPNANYNLGNVKAAVRTLEKTKIVNTIDTTNFKKQDVGAIAVNNTEERTIASNGIVPLGAANKVNEFQPLGAAYKIDNNDNENYDFVISEPILK